MGSKTAERQRVDVAGRSLVAPARKSEPTEQKRIDVAGRSLVGPFQKSESIAEQ